MDLNHILNWELKKGPHEFPGPHGGTCINEAAIVAAGFEYKKVGSAADCPPCFSRVFSAYALGLNDWMPDKERNTLLPRFILRLAGTADTPEVERQRADFLVVESMRRILPIWLRRVGGELEQEARACERVASREEAKVVARQVRDAAWLVMERRAQAVLALGGRCELKTNMFGYLVVADFAPPPAATSSSTAVAEAAAAVAEAAAVAVAAVAAAAAVAAVAAAAAVARRYFRTPPEVWVAATGILDDAMKIGRQPDPLDLGLVAERMAVIRHKVQA